MKLLKIFIIWYSAKKVFKVKIAVVFNRKSKNVINVFGSQNREKYSIITIKKIVESLKKAGHQVKEFEADKELIKKLEGFMPGVIKGELPGLVFNLAYGIQGQDRYTHVPGILEMIGFPYTGSSPLAHSLALDKVVTKMIFKQNNLPTPDFAIIDTKTFEPPGIEFPFIVKPKNEAVSFGLTVVNNEEELKSAVDIICQEYKQPALVEKYIEGREINVGILGNEKPEIFPPNEIVFDCEGDHIYTYEDKRNASGRNIYNKCPADLPEEKINEAKQLALKAFNALGCKDFARIDMRIDKEGNLYLLEINSLASLGLKGSYVNAAKQRGYTYESLINKIVEVANIRYFGSLYIDNIIPDKSSSKEEKALTYLLQKRDGIEKTLQSWCNINSRTNDSFGIKTAIEKFTHDMKELGLKTENCYTDENRTWMWETKKGFKDGALIICNIDVPIFQYTPTINFKKESEYLYGEGIGLSRANIVTLQYALRAIKSLKLLKEIPIGILIYTDEGLDNLYSRKIIKKASQEAAQVLILKAGSSENKIVTGRRGQARFRLIIEDNLPENNRLKNNSNIIFWFADVSKEIFQLDSKEKKLSISLIDFNIDSYFTLQPHRIKADILVSFYEEKYLDEAVKKLHKLLKNKKNNTKVTLSEVSNRPPFIERTKSKKLSMKFKKIAKEIDIELENTVSLWPSAAGLVAADIPVICGIGPVAENIHTPKERIKRISLLQRTLILTKYLLEF